MYANTRFWTNKEATYLQLCIVQIIWAGLLVVDLLKLPLPHGETTCQCGVVAQKRVERDWVRGKDHMKMEAMTLIIRHSSV